MKQIIGILLILGALFFGYMGVTKLDDSSKSLEVGDLELSAEDSSGKTTAYIYLGLSGVMLVGGIISLKKR